MEWSKCAEFEIVRQSEKHVSAAIKWIFKRKKSPTSFESRAFVKCEALNDFFDCDFDAFTIDG